MSIDQLTAYKLYRTLWPQKKISEAIFTQAPELALFRHDPTFFEKVRQIALGTGGSEGYGRTLTDAKAAKTASTAVEWTCATEPLYAVWGIDGDLIRRSKNDKAILIDPVKRASTNAINGWKLQMCRYIHGNGGGALAKSTTVSGQTVTLDTTTAGYALSDIRFIRPGMQLQSASTDGTTGSVNAGYVTVATVNRGAGTFTVSEASVATGIPLVANGDYWFRKGLFNGVIDGLEAWNPASAPSSTAFRGVDRSVDTDLLGGIRLTLTNKSARAAAKELANACADMGGEPDLYLLHTSDWAILEADLDSAGSLMRTQVASQPMGSTNFGIKYDAISFMGPTGPIDVVASVNATPKVGRMLCKKEWVLGSMGELLHDIDSNEVEDGADAKEYRMIGDVDFYCEGVPGHNARGVLRA